MNSIDYLLKPIKVCELKHAIEKFTRLTHQDVKQYLAQLTHLAPEPKHKDKLLIPLKDRLVPINMRDVSCFHTSDKSTSIYMRDGSVYPYAKTLEQIITTLNPADFIRANKQYIIARESVANITIWFDSRLLITLDVEIPERVYVSKNKASEFKSWMMSDF